MAATGADSVGLRPRGRRWMRRMRRRLLRCCPCLRGDGQDGRDRHGRRRGSPEVPGPPCVRVGGPSSPARCTETIHITVEDIDALGLDNPGFISLQSEEEEVFPARSDRIGVGHGVARSASACQRAMKKKRRLKALSSLPLLIPLVDATTEASGGGGGGGGEDRRRRDDEGEEEEESLWYLHGDDTEITLSAGGLLPPPPIITLIPPTPSDVVDLDDDDHQFFDDYSEGESRPSHTSGSDDRESDDDDEEEAAVDGTEEEEAGSEIETEEEDEEEEEEEEEEEMGFPLAESQVDGDDEGEAVAGHDRGGGPEETEPPNGQETGEQVVSGTPFLLGAYQVARLPEYPRKKSLNKGINLLAFTEHNLDDLSNKDMSCPQLLRAQLNLLPYTTKMETSTPIRNPARRSCSFGDGRRSPSFPMIGQTAAQNQEEEGSSRQRRITIASYMPQSSKDQNGNFAEKDNNGHGAKALPGLNTDEVCQWFSSLGLQRCLPFIREGHLCGADIASVDASTLEMLHLSTPEDRELLLSNIYRELHPPNSLTRRLDSLIETFGPQNNVESFTAALVSMSKSMSAPHVSGLTAAPSSLMLRAKSSMGQRSTQLIEITVHALEQIVHLRTPKETTVGKVQESCVKMLGLTEDTHTFTLKDNTGLSDGLSANQQIGNLLTTSKRQLELHLCKKDKQTEGETSKVNGSQDNVNQNVQPAKEEKIKELNQQVDSLQHVILQVQELHHGLVAFCSELKSVDVEADVTELSPVELRHRLESAQSQLQEKRQSLQNLKENISNAAAQRNMEWRSEIRLMDKMKLNCQVFKAEISVVHLNRQVAHLKNALQDRCDKERPPAEPSPAVVGPLSQLLSPQCPALLLVVQACPAGPDSRYGFSCCSRGAGQGLVVTRSDHSQLCLEDRLVEVNGVAVVNSTEEDLHGLLLRGGSSAQIVVLRRPSLRPASCQPPGPVHQPAHHVPPPAAGSPEGGAVVKDTPPPQRKLIAI